MIDRIQLRHISHFTYYDPRPILKALRALEELVAASPTPEQIRTLRTPGLKRARENIDAAIFTLAMSELMGREVRFSIEEESDFDFVASWVHGDTEHFCRVQQKEVVPESLNASTSVQDIIDDLSRYADLSDITIAIKLNRVGRFDPATIAIPPTLRVAALWVFGSITSDKSEWAIWGDFAEGPDRVTGRRFLYPL